MESRGVMEASEQDEDRKVMFEKAKSQRSSDDAHHEEDREAAKNMMQTEHRSLAGTENAGDKMSLYGANHPQFALCKFSVGNTIMSV